jgi:hypothetical protein
VGREEGLGREEDRGAGASIAFGCCDGVVCFGERGARRKRSSGFSGVGDRERLYFLGVQLLEIEARGPTIRRDCKQD